MSLLHVKSITASYGDSRAVARVSLTVDKGELLALVGANGAGKSTLLRVIAGAHKAGAGTVTFKDEEINELPDFQRNKLGISLVPEGRRLFASMTVEENLIVGAGSGRKGEWNIESVVEVLPMLKPLLKRTASRLSGGQQQAVAIGRSLMSNPEILLLDEVSLGLAPIIIDELYESFSTIRKAGMGIILVEQDLARTVSVSDTILCMLEGHEILRGKPSDLTHQQITDAYFGHSIEGFTDTIKTLSKGVKK